MSHNHIEIYDNSLSLKECEGIIDYFEQSEYTKKGLVGRTNINKEWKESTDLQMWFNRQDLLPNKILGDALRIGLKKYTEKYPMLEDLSLWNVGPDYNIQKYTEGEGYYVMHCEHDVPDLNRIMAWMFYLNDAKCGTRFYYPTKDVKAKRGRLVIWPASWTHPHSGITPNRGIKYIATGWFCFV